MCLLIAGPYGPVFPQPDDGPAVAEQWTRAAAERLWEAGRQDEAVTMLERVLLRQPDSVADRVRLYQWLVSAQRPDDLRLHQEILAEWAAGDEWLNLPIMEMLFVGAACADLGRPELGVPVMEEVVRRRPDIAAHHLWLAKNYAALGAHLQAGRAAAEAARLDPANPEFALLAVEQLRLSGNPAAAVEALAPSIAAGDPSGEVLRALADFALDAGDVETLALAGEAERRRVPGGFEAVAAQREAEAGNTQPEIEAVAAYEAAATEYARAAALGDARRCLERALALYEEAIQAYQRRAGVEAYRKLRWEVDRHPRLAAAYARLGQVARLRQDDALAAETDELLLARYPLTPAGRETALRIAAGPETKGAVALLALGLDTLGDHAPPAVKSHLADNALYLSQIQRGPAVPDVAAAFRVLEEDADRAWVAALYWTDAVAALNRGEPLAASGIWQELATHVKGLPLAALATLAAAQASLDAGEYAVAEGRYEELRAEAATNPTAAGLEWIVARDLGVIRMRRGEWSAGGEWLDRAVAAAPACARPRLVQWRAECHEFLGRAQEALALYEALAAGGVDLMTCEEAAYAVQRVRAHEELLRSATLPGTVVYLGEDRQTRGEWPRRYAQEACFFAAMPDARRAGPLAGQIRARVGPMTWRTDRDGVVTAAMQIDPVSGLRYHQNYCDGGHGVPCGQGPGISETFTIPAGLHRVSLYYANDLRYYEPNREHTLYLQVGPGGCAA
ncbi:MAG: hypothetical protein FJX74_20390, partial [Armatimonadetes bacterium]|nr:hypothetical protein [Armatimonadota bacterium]